MNRDEIATCVLEIVEDFIKKQKIGCAEDVYQSDWVSENSLDLIAELCEAVGDYEEEKENVE